MSARVEIVEKSFDVGDDELLIVKQVRIAYDQHEIYLDPDEAYTLITDLSNVVEEL